MALTDNKGQGLFPKVFLDFSDELESVIIQLNALLAKYKIVDVKNYISFPIDNNKVVPFISYRDGILSEPSYPNDK